MANDSGNTIAKEAKTVTSKIALFTIPDFFITLFYHILI